MITLRPSGERGRIDHGWLDTRHTFSFADYRDPVWMGFRTLRVINEDFVAPGAGFDRHPHRDMEILTVVLSGALRHEDSMGNGSVIRPGEIQRMTAGTGVFHSERNASDTERVHLLQIWIHPDRRRLPPSYEQVKVTEAPGRLVRLASPDGGPGEVRIHQDASLFLGQLAGGESLVHPLAAGRHAWVQMIEGETSLDGETLKAGDGASVSEEEGLRFEGAASARFLLFDLS